MMTNNNNARNELINRYIYAVTRQLPRKTRGDIEKELRALIDDMLDERCGELPPTEKDIRVTLAELGKPSELAAKYDTDKFSSLISGEYYRCYKKVIKIVGIAYVCGITLAMIISGIVMENALMTLWKWLISLVSGLASVFGIVTLIFAILERKRVNIGFDVEINSLPTIPEKDNSIKLWEQIVGIAFSVIFTVIFLFCPEIFSAYIFDAGSANTVYIFDCEIIRSLWGAVLAMGIVGIANSIIKAREKKYNLIVAVSSFVCAVVAIYGAYVLFVGHDIINPQIVTLISDTTDLSLTEFPGTIFNNIGKILFGIIVFGNVLEVIETVYRTIKNMNEGVRKA